jgi:hypothetical protein
MEGLSMFEKRKLKRRHPIYYLPIMDQENNEMVGKLVDITSEGLMMISEKAVPTQKSYFLDIELPEEIYGQTHLTFHAKSLWCKKDVNPEFFATGFQFLEITPEDIINIDYLIEHFGFND